MKTLLIYCIDKTRIYPGDALYRDYRVIYPFFNRYIFVGRRFKKYNSSTIRVVNTKELDICSILDNIGEKVDVFINGDIGVINLESIIIPKFFVIADSHFEFMMVKSAMNYLKKETYDGVIVYAKPEHGRFFWEKNIKTFFWPWVNPNTLSETERYKRDFDVVYIGHRVSKVNIRANKMLTYIEANVRSNNIKFQFFQHTGYENYLRILKKTRIAICCTSNSQFTPQIYLMMQSGALCLLDRPSKISFINKFFVEGVHYVGWSSFEELVQKIIYFSLHNEEAEVIAKAGERVAAQGFASYQEESIMDKMRNMVFDEMMDGYGIKELINNKNILDDVVRLEIYDVVQRLHQYYESVGVVIEGEGFQYLAKDFIDLPRVHIVEQTDKMDVMLLIAESKSAFYSSGVSKKGIDYFLFTEKSVFNRLSFFVNIWRKILMKCLFIFNRLFKTTFFLGYIYPKFDVYEKIEVH